MLRGSSAEVLADLRGGLGSSHSERARAGKKDPKTRVTAAKPRPARRGK